MAFVPVLNVAMVEMIYSQDGQFCENVHYVLNDSDILPGDLPAIAGAFKSWWNTNIKPLQALGVSLQKIRVTQLDFEAAAGIEYADGLPINSSSGLEMSPNNVTLAVKWLTAFRGRSFRGRSYMVGIPRQKVIDNHIDATYLTTLVTAWGNLVAAAETIGDGYHLVVVSRRHANADRVSGLATVISGVSINNIVDSQRRRLPERGT